MSRIRLWHAIGGSSQMHQEFVDRMRPRTDIRQSRAVVRVERHRVLRVLDSGVERIAAQEALGDARIGSRQQNDVCQRRAATLAT